MKHLMEKKKSAGMHDADRHAKMSVLKHLKSMADDELGSKLHGLKKVSVMSDSESGLEHGLDKAKEVLHGMPEKHQDLDGHEPEAMKEDEHFESPHGSGMHNMMGENPLESANEESDSGHPPMMEEGDMPDEELDQKIAHLMSLKASRKK